MDKLEKIYNRLESVDKKISKIQAQLERHEQRRRAAEKFLDRKIRAHKLILLGIAFRKNRLRAGQDLLQEDDAFLQNLIRRA